jgi:hypothetical protein
LEPFYFQMMWAWDESNPEHKAALETISKTRRAALKRLIGTGAYVVPVIASFSMAALSIDGFLHTAAAGD